MTLTATMATAQVSKSRQRKRRERWRQHQSQFHYDDTIDCTRNDTGGDTRDNTIVSIRLSTLAAKQKIILAMTSAMIATLLKAPSSQPRQRKSRKQWLWRQYQCHGHDVCNNVYNISCDDAGDNVSNDTGSYICDDKGKTLASTPTKSLLVTLAATLTRVCSGLRCC